MTTTRLVASGLLASSAALAQGDSTPPVNTQTGPSIRRISTASAVSTEQLGSIVSVRELPDGSVLVNDGNRRRLLLMDTTLRTVRVVLDSLSERANTYGTRTGALIAHRGDSTLFIDPVSLAMLVIDPHGEIARVRSVPRVQDMYYFSSPEGSRAGVSATDFKGRLVYMINAEPARPAKPPPRGVPYFPPQPDSAFIVAMNIDTRVIDTLGAIRTPKWDMTVKLMPNGGFNFIEKINPLPSHDEFAVLSDGSVAFVRAIDYRIDYLNADGTWSSSPKLPYDWQHLSDSAKKHLVDSVRTAQSRSAHTAYTTALIRWVNMYGKSFPEGFAAPERYNPPAGFAKSWKFPPGVTFPANYIYACAPGEEPKMVGQVEQPNPASSDSPTPMVQREGQAVPTVGGIPAGGRPSCIPAPIANVNAPQPPTLRDVSVLDHRELPDYKPPLTQGQAVRADADGNLWIRPIQPRPVSGGAVYDVVNRKGELFDRIQLPQGYQLVGFGRGGVVYLSMRDRTGLHLARVRLRPRE